ncbi:MAG: hypothetical protein B9S32_04675 [Verrucomicrobia bacterium Tous-C9LFEB]|nr:MAG: hypothetical protein B9S32_04675 [Verrucomicrobia bacterium Tous-C9LFEB]
MKNDTKLQKKKGNREKADIPFINDPDLGIRLNVRTKKMELCRSDDPAWTWDLSMTHSWPLPCSYNDFWEFYLAMLLRYEMPPKLVHETFLAIPEYRERFGKDWEKL